MLLGCVGFLPVLMSLLFSLPLPSPPSPSVRPKYGIMFLLEHTAYVPRAVKVGVVVSYFIDGVCVCVATIVCVYMCVVRCYVCCYVCECGYDCLVHGHETLFDVAWGLVRFCPFPRQAEC